MTDYHDIDAEVIIIGAGISGLTAAHTLFEKEPYMTFLILEATERVGGRILSYPLFVKSQNNSNKYDFGGQFFSSDQTPLMDLISSLQLSFWEINSTGNVYISCNGPNLVNNRTNYFSFLPRNDRLEIASFMNKIESLSNKLREIQAEELAPLVNKISNKTMKTFIEEEISSKTVKQIFEYLILNHCGVPSTEISVMFYAFFCLTTKGIANQLPIVKGNLHQLMLKGGAQEICEKIVDKIGRDTLIMNKTVKKIEQFENDVLVETDDSFYWCYNVILAVPPICATRIQFSPALPDLKLASLRRMAVSGVCTKFVVTYKKAFWNRRGLSGDMIMFDSDVEGPIHICYNITYQGNPALSGRIVNNAVNNISGLDREGYLFKEAVLTQLANVFGDVALNPLDYKEKIWVDNPFENLSMMYCWDTGLVRFDKVKESFERVFWAGAESSDRWYGCIAGAVFSGKRAAIEALYDLRPALITVDDIEVLFPYTKRFGPMPDDIEPYDPNEYMVVLHFQWYYLIPLVLIGFILWKMR